MIIDTHCHLIDEAFTQDVEACIVRAQEAGVQKMVLACCDEKEFPQILKLCEQHPGVLFPSIGIHPENMAEDIDAQFAKLEGLFKQYGKPLPIGEIGIDLHWDKTRLHDQRHLLEDQLDLAAKNDLPVLLHIRDAMPQFLLLLRRRNDDNKGTMRPRGILHCYSGTAQEAREALMYGDFYIGVGGTLTYKKSQVPEVVKTIGIERIVLETDAPYLAPIPHRGKRNEPAFTADTARFLADLLGISIEEVEEITTRNAETLLGI